MKQIKIGGWVFSVDLQKTREYYLTHSLCDCPGCRNLYAQIGSLSDTLTHFLSEFGINICRPDESADVEMKGCIDYLFVGYTVTGTVETEGICETDVDGYHIRISKGDTPENWFPNEQTEPCFYITVSGISLPWALAEPYPGSEKIMDKIKRFFKRTK